MSASAKTKSGLLNRDFKNKKKIYDHLMGFENIAQERAFLLDVNRREKAHQVVSYIDKVYEEIKKKDNFDKFNFDNIKILNGIRNKIIENIEKVDETLAVEISNLKGDSKSYEPIFDELYGYEAPKPEHKVEKDIIE